MAFNIKNQEADRLTRELMAITGESLTDAVTNAVRERIVRCRRGGEESKLERITRHAGSFARLPVLDDRPADEILGYDETGLPA